VTLTLDRVILHTVMRHSSTSIYIPNFVEIEETFCGQMDRRTYGHLRPTLLGRLGGADLKTGHVTLTTPTKGQFVIPRLKLYIFYLHTKFGNSRFSHSGDITGAPKFKIGHVTLTTSILRVICFPYAGNWHSLPCSKYDHSSFSHSRDMCPPKF